RRRPSQSAGTANGCRLVRRGARHELWENTASGQRSTVPRHREIKRRRREGSPRCGLDTLATRRWTRYPLQVGPFVTWEIRMSAVELLEQWRQDRLWGSVMEREPDVATRRHGLPAKVWAPALCVPRPGDLI